MYFRARTYADAEFNILNPYYEITRIPSVMLHPVLFCMQ
jgi:hypothetical protein